MDLIFIQGVEAFAKDPCPLRAAPTTSCLLCSANTLFVQFLRSRSLQIGRRGGEGLLLDQSWGQGARFKGHTYTLVVGPRTLQKRGEGVRRVKFAAPD